MVFFAMAVVSARSPELYAGWPQQVCARGTSTVQPASSMSLIEAKPIAGRNRSTRQVTNRPTRGFSGGAFSSFASDEATSASSIRLHPFALGPLREPEPRHALPFTGALGFGHRPGHIVD